MTNICVIVYQECNKSAFAISVVMTLYFTTKDVKDVAMYTKQTHIVPWGNH